MWTERWQPRATWWGPGIRTTAWWALTSSPERLTPSSLKAAALGPYVHVERTQNQAVNCGRKWMRASRLERAEPHGGSPRRQISSTACWTFCWGPMWDWKGSTYLELNTGMSMGGRKWTRTTRLEGAEPQGQITRIDEFITCHYLNRGPMGMLLRPPAHQNNPDFCVAVFNCLQELKNRPIWKH